MSLEYVTIREIQRFIDQKYHYGDAAPEDTAYLNEIGEDSRHMITRRLLIKYMDSYAKKRGAEYYGDIIRVDGSTKGQRYLKDDILAFLDDENIKERLKKLYLCRTKEFLGRRVPLCIYSRVLERFDGMIECAELGVSEYRLKLLKKDISEVKALYERHKERVRELESELAEAKECLRETADEIRSRGLTVG